MSKPVTMSFDNTLCSEIRVGDKDVSGWVVARDEEKHEVCCSDIDFCKEKCERTNSCPARKERLGR